MVSVGAKPYPERNSMPTETKAYDYLKQGCFGRPTFHLFFLFSNSALPVSHGSGSMKQITGFKGTQKITPILPIHVQMEIGISDLATNKTA